MTLQTGSILYRFCDVPDMFGDGPQYSVTEWRVIKTTRCTALINRNFGPWLYGDTQRRIYINAKRLFAYQTIEAAAYSYAMRKARQIEHAQRTLKQANHLFDMVRKDYSIDITHPDTWQDA